MAFPTDTIDQLICPFIPIPNWLQLLSVRGTQRHKRSKSTSCFFLELPKTSLAFMMNCRGSVNVRVATLLLSSEAFLGHHNEVKVAAKEDHSPKRVFRQRCNQGSSTRLLPQTSCKIPSSSRKSHSDTLCIRSRNVR
jgi:hypothetical protein